MASPVLLVADDLSTIAAVKRVLAREGYEVVLATSAADAVIGWSHHLPALLLLQPSVESDRGAVVIEELQQHPEARLLRVVMLGETLPGYPYVVEPLPIDPAHFAETLAESVRASSGEAEAWQLIESPRTTAPELPVITERDEWRSTRPGATLADGFEAAEPELPAMEVEPAAPSPKLEDRLFGDLPSIEESMHRDIEAEAIASVESSLAQREQDGELQQLEDDVRAEAQRRRQTRESRSTHTAAATLTGDEETSFAIEEPTPAPADALRGEAPAAQARELLARAEAMVLESRAAAEANRRADENEERHLAQELEASKRRLKHVEDEVRTEREGRLITEDELLQTRGQLSQTLDLLDSERAEAESQLKSELQILREEAEAFRVARERDLSEQLEAERQMVDSLQQAVDGREVAFNEVQALLDGSKEVTAQLQAEVASRQERLEGEKRANQQLNAQVTELSNELARVSEELIGQTTERDALDRQVTDLWPRLEAANTELAKLEATTQALLHSKERADQLAKHVVSLESSLSTHRTAAHETTNEREVLKGDVDRLSTELADSVATVARLTKDLAAVREVLDSTAARADTAEAGVQLAGERIQELEHRATMPLALPGRRPLGVARTGQVTLEGLAALVGQLVVAQADARLELGVSGGTRVLWFKKGLVVGAESSLPHETLIDRARRDGLIDARQESELRLIKHASGREQLDAMRSRGVLRELEAVPLAQRYTEHLALEAFAETSSQYRLADDVPSSEVLQATVPRATLPMLAEAIRRSLPVDALLETLGGGEAVCEPLESDLDLRALGFSDRERKMFSWVDGETTVEDLALASGLKQDVAFRALLVAKLMGLIAVVAPKERPVAPSGDLEVQRLDAKYDEVLEADYFTILGLGKTAGTDDVQRAFSRLSNEFDPLKYSGHPDPALQQRAQVVFTHLEEAARALEDDRRRSEYARHLLD